MPDLPNGVILADWEAVTYRLGPGPMKSQDLVTSLGGSWGSFSYQELVNKLLAAGLLAGRPLYDDQGDYEDALLYLYDDEALDYARPVDHPAND